MGMDVVGRNPSTEAGKYFRANVWSWRPIHNLIVQLCSDLLDEEMRMCDPFLVRGVKVRRTF